MATRYKKNKDRWDEMKQTRVRALQAAVSSAASALTSTAASALSLLVLSLGADRVPQHCLDALRKYWPDLPAKLTGAGEDESSVKQKLAWLISTVLR